MTLGPALRLASRVFASWLLMLPVAGAAEPDTIVVEASRLASMGQVEADQLQRLLAWRKGELWLGRASTQRISLVVTRVVRGALDDPGYASRPVGVNALPVLVLNDAALAATGAELGNGGAGIWKLKRLPDGTLAALEAEQTPFEIPEPSGRELTREVGASLASQDPQVVLEGLQKFQELRLFTLVPEVLGLLDSRVEVRIPVAIDEVTLDGHHVGSVQGFTSSTLGAEAQLALLGATYLLQSRQAPSGDAPAAAWREWWASLLALDPFPEVEIAPSRPLELDTLAMNQTWFQLWISPDGRQAVAAHTRLHTPRDGVRNGVMAYDLPFPAEAPTAWWAHEVPGRGPEPRGLVAAWGPTRGAIAWMEGDAVVFRSLNRAGAPRGPETRLEFADPQRLVLSSREEGWLIGCFTAAGEVLVQELTPDGEPRGKPVQVLPAPEGRMDYHSGVRAASLVDTPKGARLVFGGDRLRLLLLDERLRVVGDLEVHDRDHDAYGFRPLLAAGRDELCVAWVEGDRRGDRLFARLFDSSGRALTDELLVDERVVSLGPPAPDANGGCLLAYTSRKSTPSELRLARVSASGAEKPLVIQRGVEAGDPVAVGLHEDRARILFVSRGIWPFRLFLAELPSTSRHRRRARPGPNRTGKPTARVPRASAPMPRLRGLRRVTAVLSVRGVQLTLTRDGRAPLDGHPGRWSVSEVGVWEESKWVASSVRSRVSKESGKAARAPTRRPTTIASARRSTSTASA